MTNPTAGHAAAEARVHAILDGADEKTAMEHAARAAIDWQKAEDVNPTAEDFDHAAEITRLTSGEQPAIYARWVRSDYRDATDAKIARLWKSTSEGDRQFWAQIVAERREDRAELENQVARGDRLEGQNEAADRIVRDLLESLCRRDGLPLESAVTPGEPARNYELADRLGVGRVFGLQPQSAEGAVLMTGTPEKTQGQIACETFWTSVGAGSGNPEDTAWSYAAAQKARGAWEKAAQVVRAPLEQEIADLRLKLGNVWDLAKDWTEIEDRWGEPTDEAKAEAEHGRQILALLDPGDSVADHPDTCRGTCCEDARREAEAAMNADSADYELDTADIGPGERDVEEFQVQRVTEPGK